MKCCSECSRTFTDDTLGFCLYDGKPLVSEPPAPPAYYAAQAYAAPVPRRKPVPWPWILRGVVAAGLLLRLLLHFAHSTGTAAAPDTALLDSLIIAIRQADDAEAQSFRQGNPAALYPSYTGPALAREMNALQTLQSRGLYTDSRLLSQSFGDFHLSADQSEARVFVTEVWNTTVYSAVTRQAVRMSPSSAAPQEISLKRAGSGWIVEDIQPKPAGETH